MKREMVWIEAEGKLYRGFGREYAAIIWCPNERRWTHSGIATPCDWNWGELVTQREAERCYPGSTRTPPPHGIETAAELSAEEWIRYRPELFDFYDGPIYRKSPEEKEEDRAYIRRLMASLSPGSKSSNDGKN